MTDLSYKNLHLLSLDQDTGCDEANNMIDIAAINASETVFVEKSLPETEWESVFIDSLAQCCAYATAEQKPAVEWLVARGVRF